MSKRKANILMTYSNLIDKKRCIINRYHNMPEEKKQKLKEYRKEYQQKYREDKKPKLIINKIVYVLFFSKLFFTINIRFNLIIRTAI